MICYQPQHVYKLQQSVATKQIYKCEANKYIQ